MAGLFDLDIEAQILDDIAIGWDDPDNAGVAPITGIGSWGALTATATLRSFKSRRHAPRREYVWISDLSGEQIGVIR